MKRERREVETTRQSKSYNLGNTSGDKTLLSPKAGEFTISARWETFLLTLKRPYLIKRL